MKIRRPRPTVSFAAVRDACLQHVTALAPQMLPGGRWQGDWYWAVVPWRDDRRGSLAISRTTARWRDWGYEDPDNGSTLIDLGARLWGCTAAEAKDRIAGMLGLVPEPAAVHGAVPGPVRKPPRCVTCRHVWERFGDDLALRHDGGGPPDVAEAYDRRYCMAITDALEEPVPTRVARRRGRKCGTWGWLHEPRP